MTLLHAEAHTRTARCCPHPARRRAGYPRPPRNSDGAAPGASGAATLPAQPCAATACTRLCASSPHRTAPPHLPSSARRRTPAAPRRPGVAFRVFSFAQWGRLAEHTQPEMLRAPLESVCLLVKGITGVTGVTGITAPTSEGGPRAGGGGEPGPADGGAAAFLARSLSPPSPAAVSSAVSKGRAGERNGGGRAGVPAHPLSAAMQLSSARPARPCSCPTPSHWHPPPPNPPLLPPPSPLPPRPARWAC
jgi:hypothetical protein